MCMFIRSYDLIDSGAYPHFVAPKLAAWLE
ncbi:hypothetical protein AYI68_g7962, partial [Smittium mucronatum]